MRLLRIRLEKQCLQSRESHGWQLQLNVSRLAIHGKP